MKALRIKLSDDERGLYPSFVDGLNVLSQNNRRVNTAELILDGFRLTSDQTLMIAYSNSENSSDVNYEEFGYYPCVVSSDGVYIGPIPDELLSIRGKWYLSIIIVYGYQDGENVNSLPRYGSGMLSFNVFNNITGRNGEYVTLEDARMLVIASQESFERLERDITEARKELERLKSEAVLAKDEAVGSKNSAGQSATSAELAASRAESARDAAVLAKDEAVESKNSAGKSAASAELAASRAESARDAAILAKDEANESKDKAKQFATSAELAADKAEESKVNAEIAYQSTLSISANTVEVTVDENYILTVTVKSKDGTVLSISSFDFPIESAVTNIRYDEAQGTLIFTLQNGSITEIPLTDVLRSIAQKAEQEADRAKKEADKAAESAAIATQESMKAKAEADKATEKAAEINALYEKMNVVFYTDENGDLWIDETAEVK